MEILLPWNVGTSQPKIKLISHFITYICKAETQIIRIWRERLLGLIFAAGRPFFFFLQNSDFWIPRCKLKSSLRIIHRLSIQAIVIFSIFLIRSAHSFNKFEKLHSATPDLLVCGYGQTSIGLVCGCFFLTPKVLSYVIWNIVHEYP